MTASIFANIQVLLLNPLMFRIQFSNGDYPIKGENLIGIQF